MGYWKEVGLALDRLGNALCGGESESTISASTGYHARHTRGSQKVFWVSLEKVINWAFKPFDGPNHCYDAWQREYWVRNHSTGSDIARAALLLLSLPVCAVIGTGARIRTKKATGRATKAASRT